MIAIILSSHSDFPVPSALLLSPSAELLFLLLYKASKVQVILLFPIFLVRIKLYYRKIYILYNNGKLYEEKVKAKRSYLWSGKGEMINS